MSVGDQIIELFASRGEEAYFGESVSILAHSLQTAWQARKANVPDALIAAALLHDIGHLLHGLPEDIASQNLDGRHEVVGNEWLRSRFGPAVSEPVRLHVNAKRYLCSADPSYLRQLSPSSLQSLALQGGPYTEREQREFETHPFFQDAVMLRRWDDEAKLQDLVSPSVETYRDLLNRLASQ